MRAILHGNIAVRCESNCNFVLEEYRDELESNEEYEDANNSTKQYGDERDTTDQVSCRSSYQPRWNDREIISPNGRYGRDLEEKFAK